MMVTNQGEDFMIAAKQKGLKHKIVFNYAVRNAILPQTTALALSLGTITGSVLVEVIFGYPGLEIHFIRLLN